MDFENMNHDEIFDYITSEDNDTPNEKSSTEQNAGISQQVTEAESSQKNDVENTEKYVCSYDDF